MNKKGAIAPQIGLVIVIFIGVIVALIMIQAIAPTIGQTTTQGTMVNQTVTLGASGASVYVKGIQYFSGTVMNGTTTVSASNYTITNYNVDSGELAVKITSTTGSLWASQKVNLSGTYEQVGYATDSGSRAIINLILIFAAIGVVAIVIWQIYQSDAFSILGR